MCLKNGFRGNLVLSFHIAPVFHFGEYIIRKQLWIWDKNISRTSSFWQYLLSENASNLLTMSKEDPRATCDLREDREDAGVGRETNEG